MPWISKSHKELLENRANLMERLFHEANEEKLVAQHEVRILNKAVKNKHKLKTALREATKQTQVFSKGDKMEKEYKPYDGYHLLSVDLAPPAKQLSYDEVVTTMNNLLK